MNPAPFAYRLAGIAPMQAVDSPALQRIRYAGPWLHTTHPAGGTMVYLDAYPEPGQRASSDCDDYGTPIDCGDGVWFLPPKGTLDLYDLAFGDRSGEDIVLASGRKVTIPVAVTQHRQFRLTGKERLGKPITEYGKLATDLLESAIAENKIEDEDPRLWRLIALAFGQRYRSTAEVLDHLAIFTREDIDPLLGVIWYGNPKAISPANDGAGPSSPSSASEAQTSAQAKPSGSAAGQ